MLFRNYNTEAMLSPGILAMAYGLTFFFSFALLVISWWVIVFKSTLSRGYSVNSPTVLVCEGISMLLSVLADTLLAGTCMRRMPLFLFYTASVRLLRLLRSSCWQMQAMKRKAFRPSPRPVSPTMADKSVPLTYMTGNASNLHNRGAAAQPPSPAPLSPTTPTVSPPIPPPVAPQAPPPNSQESASCVRRHLFSAVFIVATVMHATAHLLVHKSIPPEHKLSYEIVLALACCGIDLFFFLVFGIVLLFFIARQQQQQLYAQWPALSGRSCQRALTVVQVLLVVFLMWKTYPVVRSYYTTDTVAHIQMSVLGPPVDPCAGEGMVMNPVLHHSVVWPALTHRRIFNFYTGSETCPMRERRSIACLATNNEGRRVLRVSATCWDGTPPRVLLHHPANSELTGEEKVSVAEIVYGNVQYHGELNATYGTAAKAAARGVKVHRNQNGLIAAVEWVSWTTSPATDVRCDPDEKLSSRPHFWGKQVLEVPLGLSASYTVQCPSLQHEEVFMVPVPADLYSPDYVPPNATAQAACQGAAAAAEGEGRAMKDGEKEDGLPPANVLLIALDSVSRPGMVRTLPKFTAWARDFKRRAAMPGGSGHIVVEPPGYTTLGFSTAGNLGPLLTGRRTNVQTQMSRLLHNTVKSQYGDKVSTSFLSGYCHDFLNLILKDADPSSGNGARYKGIDHYFFNPLCHMGYTGQHSNYQGPFSIVRRCIAGRMVVEHLLNYTTLLLRQQMHAEEPSVIFPDTCGDDGKKRRRHKRGFLDAVYLVDGHEGTHYAITLIDDALTDFMQRLEREGFFADPRNVFIILADHGSAMGHYFEYTEAGQFERTVPANLHFIHPQMFTTMDERKGRVKGESLNNYMSRVLRASTPLDLHLTLADLMDVTKEDDELDAAVHVTRTPPQSFFDAREGAAVRACGQLLNDYTKCSLTYCLPDPLQRTYYMY